MKKFAVYFNSLLLFLLPLKFGGLAVMTEAGGFYPANFSDWLIVQWPPHAIAFAGSLALLAALISTSRQITRKTGIFFLLWAIIPPLAVIPGIIHGEMDIAIGEWSMLLGCAAVIMATGILVDSDKKLAEFFAAAILCGGVFCAFYGWYQHVTALDEMRQFAAEQEALGIPLSEGMRLKLTDPRIFSTLASSNTLASLLMIVSIIAFYFSGVWNKYVTPPGQAKWTMRIFFGIVLLSVLALTRSRSVIFCVLGAGLLAIFSSPEIRLKWRLAGIFLAAIAAIAVLGYAIHFGRGTASMGERADYLRTSAILCMEHPLAGAGWGNFFRTHMRIKKSDVVESARDPHNVVAAFAGQCGIPAGLAILAVLIAPLAMLWKERFRKNLQSAVFWCGTVFTLHSLIDCDWQVPALIALMGSLYACAISQLPAEPLPKGKIWLITAAVIVITGGVFTSYRYIAGDAALSKLQDKVNPPSKDTALLLASFSVEKLAADAAGYRPDSAVIPLTLGDWYFRRGNLTAAEKHYLHALKLDPCRPALHARLAQIKLRQNNLPEAQKYMLEAHRLFPKNPEYKLPEPARLHQQ